MATTPPVTPTTATTATTASAATKTVIPTTISTISKDWNYITQHIILLLVIAALVFGSVYGIEGLIAKHDAATASKYETILNTQAGQTKALQQQLSQDSAASAQRDAQYQSTISQLSASIAQRNATEQQQQKTDATLDAVSAAQRLTEQTQASNGEIIAEQNNVQLDLPTARRVVSNLDSIPVISANLADTQKQLTAQEGLTADTKSQLADAKTLIASQNQQQVDTTKACNAQISSLKAQARKSKMKWFLTGLISGFTLGLVHGSI